MRGPAPPMQTKGTPRALRVGKRRHGIGDARSGGHRAHPGTSRHARVAVGGVPGGLLVAHVDHADPFVHAAVVDGLDVPATEREQMRRHPRSSGHGRRGARRRWCRRSLSRRFPSPGRTWPPPRLYTEDRFCPNEILRSRRREPEVERATRGAVSETWSVTPGGRRHAPGRQGQSSSSIAHDFVDVDRESSPPRWARPAVDQRRVDVGRRHRAHDRCLQIDHGRDVDVVAADQDQVGPLAGRDRARHVAEPECPSPVDSRHLDALAERERLEASAVRARPGCRDTT